MQVDLVMAQAHRPAKSAEAFPKGLLRNTRVRAKSSLVRDA